MEILKVEVDHLIDLVSKVASSSSVQIVSEINVILYNLKSFYVDQTGNDPWAVPTNSDRTRLKVVSLKGDTITFDDGSTLHSHHDQDCCESHYLSLADLTLKDFEGLEFNLTNDQFFSRVSGFGITLNPVHGWPVRIPGYGNNNGYYSSNLNLILSVNGTEVRTFDITECQDY